MGLVVSGNSDSERTVERRGSQAAHVKEFSGESRLKHKNLSHNSLPTKPRNFKGSYDLSIKRKYGEASSHLCREKKGDLNTYMAGKDRNQSTAKQSTEVGVGEGHYKISAKRENG
uniref:Uncharacterized protein n=1 Tax=Physcomitrium patens TaxID=3218 RepID=A0A2K1IYP5_PHYPA|nr:hypothetical protein PHYPA_024220 [Physcomitrium patens]